MTWLSGTQCIMQFNYKADNITKYTDCIVPQQVVAMLRGLQGIKEPPCLKPKNQDLTTCHYWVLLWANRPLWPQLSPSYLSLLSFIMAVLSHFCAGDDGDGCGCLFPHKTSSGMCAKCQKLSSFVPNSTDFETWQVHTSFDLPCLSLWYIISVNATMQRVWSCMEKLTKWFVWCMWKQGWPIFGTTRLAHAQDLTARNNYKLDFVRGHPISKSESGCLECCWNS